MSETKPYSFFKILPDGRFEFFVDASLMKSFSLCERYFYLKHVKNLRHKSFTITKPFPMAIGSWWSDVMEMFYNSLRDSIELTPDIVKDIAIACWSKNTLDASAQADPDRFSDFGDIAGAVLMLLDYYNSQYLIDKGIWKIISVEEGFGLNKEVLLGETRSVVVYWIGKPDLVVLENGRLTPVDHKTVDRIGGNTTSFYKPSTQMPGYVHATEVIAKSLGLDARVDRCIVNICSRRKPSDNPRGGKKKAPRFIRAYPNFSKDEINEWRKDVIAKCERIATCIRTNTWTWAETQCHNMYRRDCDFVKIDSSTSMARDTILQVDFVTGIPWKPYKTEEDE